LMFDAGYAADVGAPPGVSKLALAMLDEGTTSRDALGVSKRLEELAAHYGTRSYRDTSLVSLSAIKPNLKPSLEVFADLVRNPSSPKREFDRLKQLTLAGIRHEKAEPFSGGWRLMRGLLYGADHPYGHPDSGTEASVAATTVADV